MLGELDIEQLKLTARTLRLRPETIEKDYFVTKVIACLSHVEDEYFFLVFQGGTSLAKAHNVVQRMSEDVDFRIILKPSARLL